MRGSSLVVFLAFSGCLASVWNPIGPLEPKPNIPRLDDMPSTVVVLGEQ